MRAKWYVGLGAERTPFSSPATPTNQTHPQYAAVVGPFVTKRGAYVMARMGGGNPHMLTVQDAERIAREIATLPLGTWVRVSVGAGLNSDRVGQIVAPKLDSRGFPACEPGAYKAFDRRTERQVRCADGHEFTMFVNYLTRIHGA